jgi:hypothetical protein
VELAKKLGNKIEATTLHVIGKKVLEENPSNSKILMKSVNSLWKDSNSKSNLSLKIEKWQNLLFMERIQNEHVTLFSS